MVRILLWQARVIGDCFEKLVYDRFGAFELILHNNRWSLVVTPRNGEREKPYWQKLNL